jgi:putative copper resistance protein D
MDDWPYLLLRFLHYAVLLGLFGLTAYRLIGLSWLSSDVQSLRFDRYLIGLATLAPLFSAALMVQSIAAMMGQPLWLTEWATIEAMIASTSMGWAFAARMALLSGALIALLLRHRLAAGLPITVALYGLAVASLAWNGHAAALEGGIGLFHRVNDAVHLLAAGLWLGAIGWFLHLTIGAHRSPDKTIAGPLLNAMHKFAPLGMALVAMVAITGLVNAQMIFGLHNSGTVLTTGYGQLLATKMAIVALMLLCGGRNALIGKRRAGAVSAGLDTDPTASLAALRISLSIEIALAIAVIGLVAIVGLMSPMS